MPTPIMERHNCPTPFKKTYSTRSIARDELRKWKKTPGKNLKNAMWLQVYECACGYFHFGHAK